MQPAPATPRGAGAGVLWRWVLLFGGGLGLLGLLWGPLLQRWMLGLLLLLDILSSYLTGSRVNVASLVTPRPRTEERSLSLGAETLRVTVYRPGWSQPRAGLLLVNGAVEAGNDDPGIRRVGDALARVGFLVHVPELQSLKEARLDEEDPLRLVRVFNTLQGDPALSGAPVGLAGFCYGASLALLAATDPEIRDRVAFAAAVIPYGDLRTHAVDVLTSTTEREGRIEGWSPRADVAQRLPRALLGFLTEEREQALLLALWEARQAGTRQAPEHLDREELSPAGRLLLALLEAREREAAWDALAQLPPSHTERLTRLSPVQRLAGLRAPLFLYHSAADQVISAEHSRRLAEAVPPGVPVHLRISGLLQHTKLALWPWDVAGLLRVAGEGWRLLTWVQGLLAAAGM